MVTAGVRPGLGCARRAIAVLAACGSLVACGESGHTEAAAGHGGESGSAASAGGGGSNLAGESSSNAGTGANSGGGSSSAGLCPTFAPANDGHGVGALAIPRANSLLGMSARCDGAVVAVGAGSQVTVPGQAGTTLTSAMIPAGAPSESARLKFWLASFDGAGVASWISAFWTGQNDGSGTDARAALFADGSVLLGGVYSTTVSFAVGQASEKTLTALGGVNPEAYIARYDSSGELSWVRELSEGNSVRDNRTNAVAAADDGTSYALLEIGDPTPAGIVLAPGELDLQLQAGDLALTALDPKGVFTHAVRITHATSSGPIATLADGGLSFVAVAHAGASVAPGAANEMPLAESGPVLLRFSRELVFESAVALAAPGAFTPLGDGSVITSSSAGSVSRTQADGKLDWSVKVSHPDLLGLSRVTGLDDGSAWVAGELGLMPGKLELSADGSSALALTTTAETQYFVARIAPGGVPSWVVPVFGDRNLFLTEMQAFSGSLMLGGYMDAGTTTFQSASASVTTTTPSVVLARLAP